VPELRFLDSARDNLVEIASYIASADGEEAAVRFTAELIGKCEHLCEAHGAARPLSSRIASRHPLDVFKNYLIFFCYLPSHASREIFEVVNVVESHRDLIAYFGEDDS
jgi:plasmid stabilization system protein ParE